MSASLFVVDHPFFVVTDEKGRFNIEGLSAGEFTLAVWHEEFGEKELEVTIDAAASFDVEFLFKAKVQ